MSNGDCVTVAAQEKAGDIPLAATPPYAGSQRSASPSNFPPCRLLQLPSSLLLLILSCLDQRSLLRLRHAAGVGSSSCACIGNRRNGMSKAMGTNGDKVEDEIESHYDAIRIRNVAMVERLEMWALIEEELSGGAILHDTLINGATRKLSTQLLLSRTYRPPTLRHMRGLLTAAAQSADTYAGHDVDSARRLYGRRLATRPSCSLLPAPPILSLDLSLLKPPPNGSELLPRRALASLRRIKLPDQSLFYSLHGLQHVCTQLCSEDGSGNGDGEGVEQLVVANPTSVAWEHSSSVGYGLLGSRKTCSPLPACPPEPRIDGHDDTNMYSFTPASVSRHNGGSGSISLRLEYNDIHLSYLCAQLCSHIRVLILPFDSCAFTPSGLTRLRLLRRLHTLSLGLKEWNRDIRALPGGREMTEDENEGENGSTDDESLVWSRGCIRHLSIGIHSLSSESRRGTGTGAEGGRGAQRRAVAAIHARQRQMRLELLAEAANVRMRDPTRRHHHQQIRSQRETDEPASSHDAGSTPSLDSSDPFLFLSHRFSALRSLRIRFTHVLSPRGQADCSAEQIRALVTSMKELLELRLERVVPVVREAVETGVRVSGQASADSRGLTSFVTSLIPRQLIPTESSSSTQPLPSLMSPPHPLLPPAPPLGVPWRLLISGECLSPLGDCVRLRKLALEGWDVEEGTMRGWAQQEQHDRPTSTDHARSSMRPPFGLAQTLTSLTFVKCSLDHGCLALLGSCRSLTFLEVNRCKLGTSSSQMDNSVPALEVLMSSLTGDDLGASAAQSAKPSNLSELIIHRCVDGDGRDLLLAPCSSGTASSSVAAINAAETTRAIASLSPFRHLQHMPHLQTLWLCFHGVSWEDNEQTPTGGTETESSQPQHEQDSAQSPADASGPESLLDEQHVYANEPAWMSLARETVHCHLVALGHLLSRPMCALQTLSIRHCTFATEAAWMGMVSEGGMEQVHPSSLLHLDLSHATGLTDRILVLMQRRLTRLLRLDMSYARPDLTMSQNLPASRQNPSASDFGNGNVSHVTAARTPANVPHGHTESDATAVSATSDEKKEEVSSISHTATDSTPSTALPSLPSSAAMDENGLAALIDSPLCPYTPTALLSLLHSCQHLQLLRVLCLSSTDAARFLRPKFMRLAREANPACNIVASSWQ